MDALLNGNKPRFGVIGSGSWATALVKLLTNNGQLVSWYIRDINAIAHINKYHHHSSHLQSVHLNPSNFEMSNDISAVVSSSDMLLFAVPSAYFISEVSKIEASYEGKYIISAVKGFVTSDNLTIAEYFNRVHGIPFDKICVISGPCHAEEVSMERLSYITLTSKHLEVSQALCEIFRNDYVRTVTGTDIYGVEYAAALKNIYAVATGICHGLGYGDNFMAVLISSAFFEMKEFLNATHPDKDRITAKSAYLGDLLVTCYSQFSRNRTFGGMIGKGYSVVSAQLEMNQVAEGYYATKAIHEINERYNIYMPIAEAVYNILYRRKGASEVIRELTEKLQ